MGCLIACTWGWTQPSVRIVRLCHDPDATTTTGPSRQRRRRSPMPLATTTPATSDCALAASEVRLSYATFMPAHGISMYLYSLVFTSGFLNGIYSSSPAPSCPLASTCIHSSFARSRAPSVPAITRTPLVRSRSQQLDSVLRNLIAITLSCQTLARSDHGPYPKWSNRYNWRWSIYWRRWSFYWRWSLNWPGYTSTTCSPHSCTRWPCSST